MRFCFDFRKFSPLLASSSHCFVIRRYLGDSGHTGSRISCRIAGKMAKPARVQSVINLNLDIDYGMGKLRPWRGFYFKYSRGI
jgi:hypothetical protein